MSSPPQYRSLRLSDYGGDPKAALSSLLEAFNLFQQETVRTLSRGVGPENLTSGRRYGLGFVSPGSGDAMVPVKHELPQPVKLLHVNLATQDGSALSAPWSFTFSNLQNGQILITFQGLTASTAYVFSISYE